MPVNCSQRHTEASYIYIYNAKLIDEINWELLSHKTSSVAVLIREGNRFPVFSEPIST